MPPRPLGAEALQLSLSLDPEPGPPPDPRLAKTLGRITEARALVVDILDGKEPPMPIPLSQLPEYEQPADHRIVLRKGRARGDGSRSGVRLMRRYSVYIELEVAEEFERFVTAKRLDYSEAFQMAIERMLGKR